MLAPCLALYEQISLPVAGLCTVTFFPTCPLFHFFLSLYSYCYPNELLPFFLFLFSHLSTVTFFPVTFFRTWNCYFLSCFFFSHLSTVTFFPVTFFPVTFFPTWNCYFLSCYLFSCYFLSVHRSWHPFINLLKIHCCVRRLKQIFCRIFLCSGTGYDYTAYMDYMGITVCCPREAVKLNHSGDCLSPVRCQTISRTSVDRLTVGGTLSMLRNKLQWIFNGNIFHT